MVGSSKHTIFIADTRRSGVPLHSRHRRMDSWKLPGGINGSGNSRKKYFNILATSMALNELSIEMPDSIFSWKQKIENIKKKNTKIYWCEKSMILLVSKYISTHANFFLSCSRTGLAKQPFHFNIFHNKRAGVRHEFRHTAYASIGQFHFGKFQTF